MKNLEGVHSAICCRCSAEIAFFAKNNDSADRLPIPTPEWQIRGGTCAGAIAKVGLRHEDFGFGFDLVKGPLPNRGW